MTESRPPPLARDRARNLRRLSTDAEHKLWARLRNSQLNGAKFRRQHAIGPYVADFFCPQARLVVELDGGGHAERRKRPADARRTAYLESCGYKVLRVWNDEMLNNVDGVLQRIAEHLKGPSPGAARRPLPIGRGTDKSGHVE